LACTKLCALCHKKAGQGPDAPAGARLGRPPTPRIFPAVLRVSHHPSRSKSCWSFSSTLPGFGQGPVFMAGFAILPPDRLVVCGRNARLVTPVRRGHPPAPWFFPMLAIVVRNWSAFRSHYHYDHNTNIKKCLSLLPEFTRLLILIPVLHWTVTPYVEIIRCVLKGAPTHTCTSFHSFPCEGQCVTNCLSHSSSGTLLFCPPPCFLLKHCKLSRHVTILETQT